jgi:hypothetical protein
MRTNARGGGMGVSPISNARGGGMGVSPISNAYEALLEERHATPAEIARLRDAAKLAEIARNLESLNDLARAAAPPDEPAPDAVDPEGGEGAADGPRPEEKSK